MGLLGGASLAPYCASKWGMCGVDEAMRLELRRNRCSGVATLLVCPYVVDTGMFRGAFTERPTSWVKWLLLKLREQIMPVLSAEYVAASIVAAAKHRYACGNHGRLITLPWFVAPIPSVLRLLDVFFPASEIILDLVGGCQGMDNFKGHRE